MPWALTKARCGPAGGQLPAVAEGAAAAQQEAEDEPPPLLEDDDDDSDLALSGSELGDLDGGALDDGEDDDPEGYDGAHTSLHMHACMGSGCQSLFDDRCAGSRRLVWIATIRSFLRSWAPANPAADLKVADACQRSGLHSLCRLSVTFLLLPEVLRWHLEGLP